MNYGLVCLRHKLERSISDVALLTIPVRNPAERYGISMIGSLPSLTSDLSGIEQSLLDVLYIPRLSVRFYLREKPIRKIPSLW